MIPSISLARLIIQKKLKAPIVIGGFDSENEAAAVMEMSNDFEFAIWGEGEIPLQMLCEKLKTKSDNYDDIARLVYRKNNKLVFNRKKHENTRIDLNHSVMDYSDYFRTLKKYKIDKKLTCIPVENGRGCRWNKCRFCFLNTSYEYWEKNNVKIVNEIQDAVNKYGVNTFGFTGNDLIGKDIGKFENLLDTLIQIQLKSENAFHFMGEVIPVGITQKVMEKMGQLEFSIQVGYEAVSDGILKKMNKMSRFADLILIVKLAQKYGVKIIGANIIYGIPNESKIDVVESTCNLPFLRFMLRKQDFVHRKIPLAIKKGTVFFNMVENKDFWNSNYIYSLLPNQFSKNIKDRFELFQFESDSFKNFYEWKIFDTVEQEYLDNIYNYRITIVNNILHYREYKNNKQTKSIYFEPEYREILRETNNKVISFNKLYKCLLVKFPRLKEEFLKFALLELKQEYLLYFNHSMSQIISVIDIEVPFS